jgi:uncharacterized protein YdaU (DUF1376 family)
MAKDPAFLFYPNDYIGGTMGMTFEEKGAYIELLMMQFNRGHMTEHMIRQTVGQLWDNIQVKFNKDDKGLYYNERLEIEKEKRVKFTESRRNNINGVNQYTPKKGKNKGHMEGQTTSHMEDVNINEDKNKNKKGKGSKNDIPPPIESVKDYCKERGNDVDPDKWYNHYTANGWMVGKTKMKDWQASVRTWEDKKEPRHKIVINTTNPIR